MALNDALQSTFPARDQGWPETDNTRRARRIVDMALLLYGESRVAYNFRDDPSRRWVTYNTVWEAEDGGFWVSAHILPYRDMDAPDEVVANRMRNNIADGGGYGLKSDE